MNERQLLRALAIALALTFVGEVVFLLRLPLCEQVVHVPDDSFFYLRVAAGFAATGEFTFDGSNPTYGYQPLWQLVLCCLAPLLPGRAALFHGAMVLCALLHVLIGGAVFALARRLAGPAAAVVAAVLWTCNPATMVWCWGLKENSLYALLLLAALLRLHTLLAGATRPRAGLDGVVWPRAALDGVAWPRAALGYGALLGLIVCTRLNAVLVAGLLLAALFAAVGQGGGWRARGRATLLALGGAIATGAPWYVYAWLHFGSAMPTSGAAKKLLAEAFVTMSWGTPWLSIAHGLRALQAWPSYLDLLCERGYGTWLWLLLTLTGLAPLALAVPQWRSHWPRARAAWFALAVVVGTALFASFADQMLLPNYIGYADWYSVAFQIAVPVLGGVLAAPWCARWRCGAFALLLAAIACWWLPPSLGAARRLQRDVLAAPPHAVQPLDMAMWAAQSTPANARFALWDPGIIAWFSARPCVSLDPLIGAISYVRPEVLLGPGGPPAAGLRHAREQRVDYLFGTATKQGEAWSYLALPPDTFDVVWVPWPDLDVGWRDEQQPDLRKHYVLVRPRDAAGAPFVQPDDLPCGLWYPNDPARRRWITRDRDRLLAGVTLQADTVRLLLAIAASAAPLQLVVDDAVVATFAAGTQGWRCFDARGWRGHRVQVRAERGGAVDSMPQAQMVDYDLSER